MSFISRVSQNHPENNIIQAKTFGVSSNQPVFAKKALLDVSNVIHQKTAQQNGKSSGVTVKPAVKEQTMPVNKECVNTPSCVKPDSVNGKPDEDVLDQLLGEPVCTVCDNLVEDDYSDFMFKDLRLTTKQINNLALNWENPPVLIVKDLRKIEVPEAIEVPETLQYDVDSLFNDDLWQIENDLINEMDSVPLWDYSGIDSGIGL